MELQQVNASGSYVRVNPWRINWKHVDRSNFDYRIVQLNSSSNEQGQIKLLFTN